MASPETETILIVDDEMTVLSLTSVMLTRTGYTVITAASGKEALHLFEVWPDIKIDLMLVDLVMPGMNGPEVVENVWRSRPELPVLYFSGYSGQEFLRPEIARRVPYMAKPFTLAQLTRRIREVLDKTKVATAEAD